MISLPVAILLIALFFLLGAMTVIVIFVPRSMDRAFKYEEHLLFVRELLLDCFNQACLIKAHHDPGGPLYDHGCLSAYEEAQDYLLQHKIIKPEECNRD